MKIILFVVDALGVGAIDDVSFKRPADNNANTVQSLSKYYNFTSKSFWEEVNLFGDCQKCSYDYEGADSYLGHLEMIGVAASKKEFNVMNYTQKIKNMFHQYDITDNGDYLNFDKGKLFVSNNTEGEAGLSINILGDMSRISAEELEDIGKGLKKIISPPRVIVGKAFNFSENDIKDSIVRIDSKNDKLSGFSFAWLRKNVNGFLDTFSYSNLTDDSYYGNSLIDELLVNNINVSLIGKTSTMFNKYEVEKFYGNTDECINLLSNKSSNNYEGNEFIFVNVQDIDSAGHAENPLLGAKSLYFIGEKLKEINNCLKKEDLLIIVGDHGNDPILHSNHTREYVPLICLNSLDNELKRIKKLSDLPMFIKDKFKLSLMTTSTN